VTHLPSRKNQPGRVELWPLVSSPEAEIDTANLEGPRGALALPHERLAHLIAAHAKSLIGREQRARKGELLHAGHFMVLVRRRNEFVNALVRALKREGIEVAGVDRLNLGEELAIKDLLAAARFVLLPQDDLNLACLLKSPLIGLSEEQLFTLAWQRSGHLWRALRERAGDAAFAAAHARLSAWLKRAECIRRATRSGGMAGVGSIHEPTGHQSVRVSIRSGRAWRPAMQAAAAESEGRGDARMVRVPSILGVLGVVGGEYKSIDA